MSEWISVKNRLPPYTDHDLEVIVCMIILFKKVRVAKYKNEKFYINDEDITKWVTHWIGFPLPPEEK